MLTYSQWRGAFDRIEAVGLPNEWMMETHYGQKGLTLTVVEIPNIIGNPYQGWIDPMMQAPSFGAQGGHTMSMPGQGGAQDTQMVGRTSLTKHGAGFDSVMGDQRTYAGDGPDGQAGFNLAVLQRDESLFTEHPDFSPAQPGNESIFAPRTPEGPAEDVELLDSGEQKPDRKSDDGAQDPEEKALKKPSEEGDPEGALEEKLSPEEMADQGAEATPPPEGGLPPAPQPVEGRAPDTQEAETGVMAELARAAEKQQGKQKEVLKVLDEVLDFLSCPGG